MTEHVIGLCPVELANAGDGERERAIAALFDEHHAPLVRLAALLGADDPEDVVSEAFYQLYRRWRKLRDPHAAAAYLRSVVCNLTRMRLRHIQVVRRYVQRSTALVHHVLPVENDVVLRHDRRALIEAIGQLPARQREALVLRYWLGLRGAEIASAMGISVGAVKAHTSRGMAALTRMMEART